MASQCAVSLESGAIIGADRELLTQAGGVRVVLDEQDVIDWPRYGHADLRAPNRRLVHAALAIMPRQIVKRLDTPGAHVERRPGALDEFCIMAKPQLAA